MTQQPPSSTVRQLRQAILRGNADQQRAAIREAATLGDGASSLYPDIAKEIRKGLIVSSMDCRVSP